MKKCLLWGPDPNGFYIAWDAYGNRLVAVRSLRRILNRLWVNGYESVSPNSFHAEVIREQIYRRFAERHGSK